MKIYVWYVDKNILVISGLATTAFLNTKIAEVENDMPSISDLATKMDYNAEISDIEAKYFTAKAWNENLI